MYIKDSAIEARGKEEDQAGGRPFPVLTPGNIHYAVSEKGQGICWGGLGVVQQLAGRLGLAESIDRHVKVLKRHLPYHESDHVLSQVYNVMSGGVCLQDAEAKRRDGNYRRAVGASRLPAPSTSGDFLRRFSPEDVEGLQEAFNEARLKVWAAQPKPWRKLAVIDVDGTIAPTCGECKQGMGLSYNGQWSYHPLVISLANSNEVLYTSNRSGNRPSHDGAAAWIDRAVDLARRGGFKKVRLRGDTDFALTAHFDRWTEEGVEFIFGMDAHPSFVKRAEAIPEERFRPLERRKRKGKGKPRRRAKRVKEEIVVEKGYHNLVLVQEDVAEMDYRPVKCGRSYRMVVLRKRIHVKEGQKRLFDRVDYFFYVCNVPAQELPAPQAVYESNGRCNQENVIEQLKNGVEAMRMPSDTLESNWVYLVIASQAWNLKSWLGLALPEEKGARKLVRMHFRRFLREWVQVPCQVVRRGGRLIFRLLSRNQWTPLLLQGCVLLRSGRLAL